MATDSSIGLLPVPHCQVTYLGSFISKSIDRLTLVYQTHCICFVFHSRQCTCSPLSVSGKPDNFHFVPNYGNGWFLSFSTASNKSGSCPERHSPDISAAFHTQFGFTSAWLSLPNSQFWCQLVVNLYRTNVKTKNQSERKKNQKCCHVFTASNILIACESKLSNRVRQAGNWKKCWKRQSWGSVSVVETNQLVEAVNGD